MRILSAAVGAALLVLAASPALASDPRGGHGGGGHHPPSPPPPSCCHGGGNTNVNVNVNAHASAEAFASAGSYFNAHAYDVGSIRSGAGGGGTIYVGGGGYGGDYYGGYVGAIYGELIDGEACPPAPFGYVVGGFGRDDRRPSRCSYRGGSRHDRGGRYGYSERRGGCHDPCRGPRGRDDYGYAEDYEGGHSSYGSTYESYESYEESSYGYAGGHYEESSYGGGRYDDRRGHDCDCRGGREPAPYPPPYLPEPPRYDPPRRHDRYDPPPSRPRRERPRQEYRQEPGERG